MCRQVLRQGWVDGRIGCAREVHKDLSNSVSAIPEFGSKCKERDVTLPCSPRMVDVVEKYLIRQFSCLVGPYGSGMTGSRSISESIESQYAGMPGKG